MRAVFLILLVGLVASKCPEGETSCPLKDEGEGCCPYSEAVCCSDKEHCCPNGYTCDVEEGRCNLNTGNEFLAFVGLMEKVKPASNVEDTKKCITDILNIITAAKQLVADAGVESPKILVIINDLIVLIGEGKNAVADCKQSFESSSVKSAVMKLGGPEECLADISVVVEDIQQLPQIAKESLSKIIEFVQKLIQDAQKAATDCGAQVNTSIDFIKVMKCAKDIIKTAVDAKKLSDDIALGDMSKIIADIQVEIEDGKLDIQDCINAFKN